LTKDAGIVSVEEVFKPEEEEASEMQRLDTQEDMKEDSEGGAYTMTDDAAIGNEAKTAIKSVSPLPAPNAAAPPQPMHLES